MRCMQRYIPHSRAHLDQVGYGIQEDGKNETKENLIILLLIEKKVQLESSTIFMLHFFQLHFVHAAYTIFLLWCKNLASTLIS